ncbi:MAG: hypothetical protein A3J65_03670 [Candidatus Buchananbacteria bacterium RIFCSPHIGHO2_02_FULL_45_11b]|uniref:Uncharacterized protein n=4 Tax=Candidatus Buchananiibacteriota TaxID=1817903 RepID=A0A1G1YM04_9BACT|nr:MAG: hypothetical protein A2663_03410 [Candidatus Buchananbacteria bacterium RIFCSPHIGHO2_01_FULL_46_12]OGY50764.1 MAG: hypothetical protein A3J65_03670 [Candidatus Buchananbacteria bacterium RIFCSPHIGHO2_02_FULL_45_11b]OGY53311.1 MAG: hypothetical protein A3B15_03225 [Candidatus Buchananbacteria bacterium RIFCSPLOWO2_01_FULL_45_31]OGY55757.1 MAG: hypothetical protein A3H67_02565 [Candidatus Buchananbacteria bacterium RIFCSPLOWO2_02_FULL_46_11b]
MDKPKPHFINPEGEEVYREKRPADNLEKLNERNIIEGYKAIEVSKKLKGEKTPDFSLMSDEEIMEYHRRKSQELPKAA